jgi:hypothetical protein
LGACIVLIGSKFVISNSFNVILQNISLASETFVAFVFCLLAQFLWILLFFLFRQPPTHPVTRPVPSSETFVAFVFCLLVQFS